MAELRTIQQSEIRDFLGIRYLLALADHYAVVPNPLQALGYSQPEHHILVMGPSGLHLLSYALLYPQNHHMHFLDLAKQLEQSSALLFDFFGQTSVHVPPFHLYIVVQDGNIEGEATPYVSFVPWSKLRQRIESGNGILSAPQMSTLLKALKAEVSYQRIDRYHILCELERGPQQSKFLAMNTVDDKPVVLKEVRLPYAPEEMTRNIIIRGAKLAMELDHPNIVRVEKLIPKEDRFYIVSEWCEGGISLKQYMSEHPGLIPLTTAIQLIKDLCQALMYAHNQGVIHRNLTPENMQVTAEHRLKVFNFDVAKKSDMHTLHSTDFKKLTQENPYAAPEYMIGTHQVDQRVDVYAIGVIFYELLTGRKPAHYDESRWNPPSQIISGLPHYMDRLIARAIRFDKEQRFSTVRAFYTALEKGVNELVGSRYEILQDAPYKPASKNSLLYKAIDRQSEQEVALKKLLIPPTTDHSTRLKILSQNLEPLQALKDLSHPGLIRLHETLIEDDDAYVVMNWVTGRDLRETLQKRPTNHGLLPEEVRHIAFQLSGILEYIHEQGFVHGDIKPENVMLSDGGKVTLLDFIPWHKDEKGSLLKIPKTVRYMAPELLNGTHSPSEQTDIFALGVLMYELLTHRFPYDIAQLKGQIEDVQVRPEPLEDDVPESLRKVVMRALSFDPHERYQHFHVIQAALELDFALPQDLLQQTGAPPDKESSSSLLPRAVWALALLGAILSLLYGTMSAYQIMHKIPVAEEIPYD